ncbi:hypothetical protein BBU94A_C04 (plasmid) [Borreliella burgdorferi 94a]|nr:hypothetical protein BBU94A_C04 [Borreliella burgdorferi 94a]
MDRKNIRALLSSFKREFSKALSLFTKIFIKKVDKNYFLLYIYM